MQVNSNAFPNRTDEVMMDILLQMEIVSRTPGHTPGTFINLSQAFEAGCHQADFQIVVDGLHVDTDIATTELFKHYTTLQFQLENGSLLQTGDTIGVFDRVNYRMAYVVVLWPGHNLVYYTHASIDERESDIRLHATTTMQRASRIMPNWRDGNHYDKIMLANLFGFAYSKENNTIQIPKGIVDSAFSLAKQIAVESQSHYNAHHATI